MMEKEEYEEILNMLTVIYKRLSNLEKKVEGGLRTASNQTYLNELKREANRINN